MTEAAPEASWRRESRIAELALRLTGVLGGAAIGALVCALTDSARSRPLLFALMVVGAGVGFFVASQVQLRLPTAAGGRGLNALSPTLQGVLFLAASALAGVAVLLLSSPLAYWWRLWAGAAAASLGVVGVAALLYRVDWRWYGLLDAAPETGRDLAIEVVVSLVLTALPPPLNLGALWTWTGHGSEHDPQLSERDAEEVRQYGSIVLGLELGLLFVLGLLWLGRQKLGLA